MLETKIFVYGTLMQNFRNYNKYLKGKITSIAPAYIYGKLYHLGIHDCPAIIDGTDKVYGQVLSFNDDSNQSILNSVDRFEKYFFDSGEIIYERKSVDVHYLDNSIERLSFYKLTNIDVLKNENTKYISSGNWKDYLENAKKR
jgi:gamma-glutamylcyclotransferase (GGCT)/AIG2-like uncharacterized protein YtfP